MTVKQPRRIRRQMHLLGPPPKEEPDMPSGWLGERIREAQAEIARWPKWKQEAARFEGEERR